MFVFHLWGRYKKSLSHNTTRSSDFEKEEYNKHALANWKEGQAGYSSWLFFLGRKKNQTQPKQIVALIFSLFFSEISYKCTAH